MQIEKKSISLMSIKRKEIPTNWNLPAANIGLPQYG